MFPSFERKKMETGGLCLIRRVIMVKGKSGLTRIFQLIFRFCVDRRFCSGCKMAEKGYQKSSYNKKPFHGAKVTLIKLATGRSLIQKIENV